MSLETLEEISKVKAIIADSLNLYFDPPPGDLWWDYTSLGGAVVATNTTTVLNITWDVKGPLFVTGWATSPTQANVRYVLYINNIPAFRSETQPSTDLWHLAPVRMIVAKGPVQFVVKGTSKTGGTVPGVFCRVQAHTIGGFEMNRNRLVLSS